MILQYPAFEYVSLGRNRITIKLENIDERNETVLNEVVLYASDVLTLTTDESDSIHE